MAIVISRHGHLTFRPKVNILPADTGRINRNPPPPTMLPLSRKGLWNHLEVGLLRRSVPGIEVTDPIH